MNGPSPEVLDDIERQFSHGISSTDIVALLEEHGYKFGEATLRKYVQLGLLPRSIRVGRKGKQKGSQGMYPPSIIRQIIEIKQLLNDGRTIEEIKNEFFLLRSEIETVEQGTETLFERVEIALEQPLEEATVEAVSRELKTARQAAEVLLEKLRNIEARLARRSQLVRDTAQTG